VRHCPHPTLVESVFLSSKGLSCVFYKFPISDRSDASQTGLDFLGVHTREGPLLLPPWACVCRASTQVSWQKEPP
jgi:hypothetical protein